MNKQGIGNVLAIFLFFVMLSVAESQVDYSWLKPRKGIRRTNMTCLSGRILFPYGPECADFELSKDLIRSEVLHLGFNLSFMGHQFDQVIKGDSSWSCRVGTFGQRVAYLLFENFGEYNSKL